MTIFVTNLLIKGIVGRVKPGLTVEQIESILGPPDAVGNSKRKKGRIPIYRYGNLEMYFREDGSRICQSMFIENQGADLHLPETDNATDTEELSKMTIEDFRRALGTMKVQSYEEPTPNDGEVRICAIGGACLVFNESSLIRSIFIDLDKNAMTRSL